MGGLEKMNFSVLPDCTLCCTCSPAKRPPSDGRFLPDDSGSERPKCSISAMPGWTSVRMSFLK